MTNSTSLDAKARPFPLFLDVQDRPVLVIGAGAVAARKIALLCASGARITVMARRACESIRERARAGELELILGDFERRWLQRLDAVWLVVVATDQPALNEEVARAADERRIWCNVVDDVALSSAQVPAIVDRNPVVVAISSAGTAPTIARRLRARIESWLEPAIGDLAKLAGRHRGAIRMAYPKLQMRRAFYDWLLDGPVLAALRCRRPQQAETLLDVALQRQSTPALGRVLLVGAGPGDPGLLTLRGLRALQRADVILHDRLVSPQVLEMARRDAIRLSVGKAPGGDHEATQRRIHALLREHARQGRCVVRLKGGDPLIYGRGGEELQFLRANDIPFEVVPGITAASACSAYAGIPLTHRDYAGRVTLLTGHRSAPRGQRPLPDTRVYYMALGRLAPLCTELLAQGMDPATPCALVENGSQPTQRTVHAVLGTLAHTARDANVRSPALLIVGQVAALGRELAWFGETDTAGLPKDTQDPEPLDIVPQPSSAGALAAAPADSVA